MRVYVSGVFDLLHKGHLKMFDYAKNTLGAYLIVGVCRDEDAASYKRVPVQTLEERMFMLRHIKTVDEVVVETSSKNLTDERIAELNIDYIITSEEYKNDTVFYRNAISRNMVKWIPRDKCHSTTSVITQILERNNEFPKTSESSNQFNLQQIKPDYDFSKSTSDNYRIVGVELHEYLETCLKEESEIDEIRRGLDYSWHTQYVAERRQLQNSIIKKLLGTEKPPSENPMIIFMSGCMGVGKTHFINSMSKIDVIPSNQFLYIDPDRIKNMFPESMQYRKNNHLTASTLLHMESSEIAEILLMMALKLKRNIIFDTSLRDIVFFDKFIKDIKRDNPEYTFGLLFLTAELNTILNRCVKRSWETHRVIPTDIIKSSHQTSEIGYNKLKHLFDWYYSIDNQSEFPIIIDGGNIGSFVSQFDSLRGKKYDDKNIEQLEDKLWPVV